MLSSGRIIFASDEVTIEFSADLLPAQIASFRRVIRRIVQPYETSANLAAPLICCFRRRADAASESRSQGFLFLPLIQIDCPTRAASAYKSSKSFAFRYDLTGNVDRYFPWPKWSTIQRAAQRWSWHQSNEATEASRMILRRLGRSLSRHPL